jgi:SAM-dependent methyltransferase
MISLRQLERTWETLAQEDPMWAICTDPTKTGRRWQYSEFMATGEREISRVTEHSSQLGIEIDFTGTALDFGCGIGRLTHALSKRFRESIGIDISKTMIEKAQSLAPVPERCRFLVNRSSSLDMFADGKFSFIYSNIVLQHMMPRYATRYIQEFVRVLRPGGVMVFQTADSMRGTLLLRLKAATRIRTRLKSLFGVDQMTVHFLPEAQVRESLFGAQVVDVSLTNALDSDFNGSLLFRKQEPVSGPVSKLYTAVKKSNGTSSP